MNVTIIVSEEISVAYVANLPDITVTKDPKTLHRRFHAKFSLKKRKVIPK